MDCDPGHLVVSYSSLSGSQVDVDIPFVEHIYDSIGEDLSVTPIVTYSAENAFTFDRGALETYSMTFRRKHPYEVDDSSSDQSLWSNKKWKEQVTAIINRWQAETNGCRLVYIPPLGADRPTIPETLMDNEDSGDSLNVFFSRLEIDYDISDLTYLVGSINVTVCSMDCVALRRDHGGASNPSGNPAPTVYFEKMTVAATDNNLINTYALYYPSINVNCIEKYTLNGGPKQPFEYIQMYLEKHRMEIYCPDLIDELVAGKNRITINGIGTGNYILSKVQTSRNSVKLTMYSPYEQYKGFSLPIKDSGGTAIDWVISDVGLTPLEVIRRLVNTEYYSVTGEAVNIQTDHIHYWVESARNKWFENRTPDAGDTFTISKDCSVWQVLQLCALKLRASIFISGNDIYIIDLFLPTGTVDGVNFDDRIQTVSGWGTKCYPFEFGDMYLNLEDHNPPEESISSAQANFVKSVIGEPELGSEGSDTLENAVYVSYGGVSYTPASSDAYVSNTIASSIKHFGGKLSEIKLDDVIVGFSSDSMKADLLQHLASNASFMAADTAQSISFDLAEIHRDTDRKMMWEAYFPVFSRADSISDIDNDVLLTNKSSFGINADDTGSQRTLKQKTAMTGYERHFPEGYTTYTFGQIAQADLTQTVSEILSKR